MIRSEFPSHVCSALNRARQGPILLVEPPATIVEADIPGFLSEVVLNHPKYSLLLLANDLQLDPRFQGDVSILDLKQGDLERRQRGTLPYGPYQLNFFEVGRNWESISELFSRASVVGITANFAFERAGVASVLAFARRVAPEAVLIVGGHDATAAPRWYLEAGADICVLGDGEGALGDLLMNSISELSHGVAFFDEDQLRCYPRRKFNKLRASCLPSPDLVVQNANDQTGEGPLPKGIHAPIAAIETSRGCEEACSFCDSSFITGKYRSLPLPELTRYTKSLAHLGVRTLCFLDDNLLYRCLSRFGGNRERTQLIAFFDDLFQSGFSWSFYNGLQLALFVGDSGPDIALIESLFRNEQSPNGHVRGCFRCLLPVEKLTLLQIQRFKKLMPLEETKKVIDLIASQRVPELTVGMIIGDPEESHARLRATENEAMRIADEIRKYSGGATEPRFFPFCSIPLPGTPDYTQFKPHIRYPVSAFSNLYSQYTSVIASEELQPWEICTARLGLDLRLNSEVRLNNVTRIISP